MNLIALLQGVGGPWAYVVVAAAGFLESAAFVGLVVPGETVMLLGGVLAAAGQADLAVMVVVAFLGAVAGDQVGYTLGRALGPSLRTGRAGRWIGHDRWARAEELIARRGGPAVFLGRWIGFLRAVVPAAAGAVGLPRRTFTAWNVVGGALWATTVVVAGYLAGASWQAVQAWLGTGALIAGVAIVIMVVGALAVRRRRSGGARAARGGRRPASGSRTRIGAGVAAGLVLAVAAGELSDAVTDHPGATGLDLSVLAWMLAHRTPTATRAAELISAVAGDVAMAVLAVVVAAVLAYRRRWRDAALVAVVTVGVGVIVETGKLVLARPRPPLVLQLTAETNASFPSGHTTAATAVLGVVAALLVRHLSRPSTRVVVWLIAASVAVLVGLSRLYLGAHWATDVVGAWLLGGLWLVVCLTATRAWTSSGLRARRAPGRPAAGRDAPPDPPAAQSAERAEVGPAPGTRSPVGRSIGARTGHSR